MTVVLFDLEGTLVQTIEDDPAAIRDFRESLIRKLTAVGVPPSAWEGEVKSTLIRNKAIRYAEERFDKRAPTTAYTVLQNLPT